MYGYADEFTVLAVACLFGSLALSIFFAWLYVEVGGRIEWTSRIFAGAGLACLAAGYVVAVTKVILSVPDISLLVSLLPVAALGFFIRMYAKNIWYAE